MARPLRIEFSGALYHITSRGDRREAIYVSQFGLDRGEACQHYRRFVLDGVGRGIWEGLRQQIYLGDEAFVERMQNKAKIEGDALPFPRPNADPTSCGHRRRSQRSECGYCGCLRYWRLQLPGDCRAFWRTFSDGGTHVRQAMQQSEN